MKQGIHPEYVECTVTCACGNTFQTHSTKAIVRLEICSSCHPFFTGHQKFVDTAGRVERFQKRFAKTGGETLKATTAVSKTKMAKGQKAGLSKKKTKILSSAPLVVKPAPGSGKTAPAAPGAAAPAAKPAAPAKATH